MDRLYPEAAGVMRAPILLIALVCLVATACEPKVKIEAPDKPIVINLNVKIEQEVRIRVEKDVEDLIEADSDLF